MFDQAQNWLFRSVIAVGLAVSLFSIAISQDVQSIDPRLVEIADLVEDQSKSNLQLRQVKENSILDPIDVEKLEAVDQLKLSFFSQSATSIREAIAKLEALDVDAPSAKFNGVIELYEAYAQSLDEGLTSKQHLEQFSLPETPETWLESYFALELLTNLRVQAGLRQAALQSATDAIAVIPTSNLQTNLRDSYYAKYARSSSNEKIAYLHAIQGNTEQALNATLEYLRSADASETQDSSVSFINNLIYSFLLTRNSDAQIYLSERLVEIEGSVNPTIPGMSQFRASQAMNMAGRFEEGLQYADQALAKLNHPTLERQASVSRAVALAGLSRSAEARALAKKYNVNLSLEYLLTEEKRHDALYLGYLLAAHDNSDTGLQLYRRQLDVTAEKFFENNSRDTTAMLAELENSRERQLERAAASAREAQLQALTIDRQRNLNRALMLLTLLLSFVAIGSFLFMKSREKLMRKLEIKTVEAASAEKLKTEFLGMISHELRTPLNGIIGISDFLANYHDDPDIREKTGIVLRSGNELLSVVESLTDMARLDAGQLSLAPHDADLSISLAAVPETWAEKAEEKDLAFTHFIDPAIGLHNLDEDRLIQCLNILLANAVSFTDAGRVHLHVTGNVNAQNDVTGLTAIVADTGQGMSELVQSRLFTPFMQADTSRKRAHMGTGLSLAIAYALADMMGGRLSVISREGRGSEFKLEIPLATATGELPLIAPSTDDESISEMNDSDAPETVETEEPVFDTKPILDVPVLDSPDAPTREVVDLMQPRSGFPSLHDVEALELPTPAEGRQRILVVDDVDSNRDILRLILESQGHSCSEAADGFAALAMLERKPFDLVVLDIHMTPLDGVETLRRMRSSGKTHANIPVIALTADNAASTNAACMEAGADLFLTKPVKQEELLRAIRYLHQAEGARILSQ